MLGLMDALWIPVPSAVAYMFPVTVTADHGTTDLPI
jgi:hypothetical protein